jgi:hypothetical protein
MAASQPAWLQLHGFMAARLLLSNLQPRIAP